MSDSQAYEEVTVASDGVTVVKRFEEDEFPVPAIAFEFTSDRDEAVTVQLSDTVPDGIEVEDLGFHPEYGSEYWTIDDDTITFERSIDANSSYTTVYGIRATGSDNVEQFLTEPTIEDVDPPLPEDEQEADDDDDIIPESGDDVVKDAIAGDGEIPGLEDDDEDDDVEDEDVETLNLKDPNAPEEEQQQAQDTEQEDEDEDDEDEQEAEETDEETDEDTGETAETGEPAEVSVDGDSLVSAMANEIRQKNVSAEDVKLLRRAFEIAAEDGGTTAAKIEQIQTDIADLRAYTSSLEEFLGDNGTAEQIIGDFEEQIDEFDSKLGDIQDSIDANSDEISSVSEEIDGVSDEIESVSGEVDSVSGEIDDVRDEIDDVSSKVDTVSGRVDSVTGDVDSVSDNVSSLEEKLDEFDSTIDDIQSDVASLEEEVTDGDVAERLDSIEQEIDDLQTWQEEIKSTFGG